MRKKRSNKNLLSSSEVLQRIFTQSKFGVSSQYKKWKLIQNWEEIVGETIAKHSLPIKTYGRTLLIWVDHPTRFQEFNFLKKNIIIKVNDHVGENWIQEIKFTLNNSIE